MEFIVQHSWTIAGSILGFAFVGWIAWRNNFKSRRALACSVFRSAVHEALAGLYPIPSNWPKDSTAIDPILRAVFPKLQIAVAAFRSYVPLCRRWAFNRAWFIYRLGKYGREIDQQYYLQYIPSFGVSDANGKHNTHDNTLTYKDDFRRNVERLLKYADGT